MRRAVVGAAAVLAGATGAAGLPEISAAALAEAVSTSGSAGSLRRLAREHREAAALRALGEPGVSLLGAAESDEGTAKMSSEATTERNATAAGSKPPGSIIASPRMVALAVPIIAVAIMLGWLAFRSGLWGWLTWRSSSSRTLDGPALGVKQYGALKQSATGRGSMVKKTVSWADMAHQSNFDPEIADNVSTAPSTARSDLPMPTARRYP